MEECTDLSFYYRLSCIYRMDASEKPNHKAILRGHKSCIVSILLYAIVVDSFAVLSSQNPKLLSLSLSLAEQRAIHI